MSNPQLPNLITPLPGPRAATIIARDREVISPSYTRDYPLVIERGEGAMVVDPDGNRFLDANAGIATCSTGHSHPRVVAAIQEQAARFLHMSGTDFYYEGLAELGTRLAATAPGGGPRRVYFGNSGTEAIEAAIKLARYSTGRDKFIAFYGSFHGRTLGALSLTSSRPVQRARMGPLMPGVTHIPYPNCYRCAYGRQVETCNVECIRVIDEQLVKTILPAHEVAGVVMEPVQGEGGYLVPPRKAVAELQETVHRHGMLLIADEVQSGMGRTGKMWASEHFDAAPDIMASAKGIASGMPLSATIARAEVMDWRPGAHASTFGGNPVSIAAALATLDLLQGGLTANAARVGAHMRARMEDWPQRFRHVGQVRGIGLMIGIELVLDQQTRERAPAMRDSIVRQAFERGVLILGAGENTIRLSPPLIFTQEQADFLLDTLEELLAAAGRNAGC